jgi:hypothetical protein
MRKSILPIALGVAALAAVPALARDRDHDGMSDRWEHQHHLRIGVNDAKGDPDHDGLRNRAEFRTDHNPRRSDSDGDGIRDGKEHAGTVKSFDNGVLTITLATGGTLTGQVTGATELKCDRSSARAASHGSDDGSNHDANDDHGDDGPNHDANDDHGDDGPNHDHGDDDGNQRGGRACSTSALVPGAAVHEAELKAGGGGAVYKEVELAS